MTLVLRPAVEDFIGIPYRNRGDSFDGCDCWGLVWLYSRQVLGREVPRYAGYADAEGPDIPARITEGWKDWQVIRLGEELPGDVLALRLGSQPIHAGIVVWAGTMLHTLAGRESCLESYTTGAWKHALVRIGRWTS